MYSISILYLHNISEVVTPSPVFFPLIRYYAPHTWELHTRHKMCSRRFYNETISSLPISRIRSILQPPCGLLSFRHIVTSPDSLHLHLSVYQLSWQVSTDYYSECTGIFLVCNCYSIDVLILHHFT